jgi:hypothetical protein
MSSVTGKIHPANVGRSVSISQSFNSARGAASS